MNPNVLFILKNREGSGGPSRSSSGLRNSASYVAEMLTSNGLANTKVVSVIDGNGIDKEVSLFKPDIVILEAVWCPPYKLDELVKLWPKVKWVVRIHSEVPFLANEGMAIQWISSYSEIPRVQISCNSVVANADLNQFDPVYLPNYYPTDDGRFIPPDHDHDELDVGCFGAIRPLKNQLAQAFAAIAYAKRHKIRALSFYINATRTEQGGEQVLKNLRELFYSQPDRYMLIESRWREREDFLDLVKKMDICTNVSFSETFCITAADAVGCRIPIVVSDEISWADYRIKADPTNINDIASKMEVALGRLRPYLIKSNFNGLTQFNRNSVSRWERYLIDVETPYL